MRAGSTRLGIDPAWSRCASVALDDGTVVEVHALDRRAAGRRRGAADGRLRARQPDVVDPVALVPPSPRRPLPRRRGRPGLDGALGADAARGATPSESTISAGSSTRSRSTGRSSSQRTTGVARSRSAGPSSTRSGCAGSSSATRASRLPSTGVPLPIRLAGIDDAARPRLPTDVGVRPRHARDGSREDRS